MTFRSKLGASFGVLLGFCVFVAGIAALRVHAVTHPPRHADEGVDFASMHIQVSTIRFPAADGTQLAGWVIEGRQDRPPIILCHEFGSSKISMVNLAIRLHERGFPLLMLDFRGHGASEGRGSTLGLLGLGRRRRK